MPTPIINNYAVMAERARQLFLTYDQAQMCARLGLPMTDEHITVRFLGAPYRICRCDARVLGPDGAPASFNAVMTIYDALARDNAPRLRGEFVRATALHGIRGTHAVHEDLHPAGAQRLAGKTEALERALISLGGRRWEGGDTAYLLDVFDFFPVGVRFWDADEEFPASLQFFWDANATAFLHYETLWYVMGELTDRLVAAAEKE